MFVSGCCSPQTNIWIHSTPRPIKSESHGCAPNSFLKVSLEILIIRISRGTLRSFSDSSVGKEFACNAGDPGSIPGSESSPGEGIGYLLQYSWASLVAQLVKNPPAMLEARVWSLGWEDPLEKGKVTHSSILAWRSPWTIYSSWGCKESDTTEWISPSPSLSVRKALQMGDPGLTDLSEGMSYTPSCLQGEQHATPETVEALGTHRFWGQAPLCPQPLQQWGTGHTSHSKNHSQPTPQTQLLPTQSLPSQDLLAPETPTQQYKVWGRGG